MMKWGKEMEILFENRYYSDKKVLLEYVKDVQKTWIFIRTYCSILYLSYIIQDEQFTFGYGCTDYINIYCFIAINFLSFSLSEKYEKIFS